MAPTLSLTVGFNVVSYSATTDLDFTQAAWFTTANVAYVGQPSANGQGLVLSKPGSSIFPFTSFKGAAAGTPTNQYFIYAKQAFTLDGSLFGLDRITPAALQAALANYVPLDQSTGKSSVATLPDGYTEGYTSTDGANSYLDRNFLKTEVLKLGFTIGGATAATAAAEQLLTVTADGVAHTSDFTMAANLDSVQFTVGKFADGSTLLNPVIHVNRPNGAGGSFPNLTTADNAQANAPYFATMNSYVYPFYVTGTKSSDNSSYVGALINVTCQHA